MGAITSKTTTVLVDDTEIRTVEDAVRLENIKYVFGTLVGLVAYYTNSREHHQVHPPMDAL